MCKEEIIDRELDEANIFKNPLHVRMLNKQITPTIDDIKKHIGEKPFEYISTLKDALEKFLEINMELKFPFGNDYGWGYKVSSKSKHLFYLFFEKNSINIMSQIGGINTEKEIGKYDRLSDEGKKYWQNK